MRKPTKPVSLDDCGELLTSAETEAVLRISRTTLWRMKRDGLIQPVMVGRSIRYRKADLLQLLSDRDNA